jgi:GTPase
MLDQELMDAIKSELPAELPVIFISSVSQTNIPQLKDLLWQALTSERNENAAS